YTGEVSPAMLAPLCRYVILGHSERRQYFGETNEIVNRKVRAALAQGLRVIMCVGENLAQNEANETETFVSRQVREGLQDVPSLAEVVIAYEPIWAIGTGKAATVADAAAVTELIRRTLREMYGAAQADDVRIQYGGSVTAANIRQFIEAPGIDGALVGGASLKADDFVAIVRLTAEAKA
ncbi:MAG: triose-phosphate isomerase, partial [Chloroflexota bacterium]